MARDVVVAAACALAACGSSSQPQSQPAPAAAAPSPSARPASPTQVSTRPPSPAPAPPPRWDVVLGESSWTTENAAGSQASMRDHVLMAALGAAFGGDSAAWCKTGGQCWTEVRDVACDRAQSICKANGAADTVDPETPVAMTATGDAARALLAELDARAWCTGASCQLAAIACFSDRHDERSDRPGPHQTYTCEAQLKASAPSAPAAPVAHGRRDLRSLGVPVTVEASPELDADRQHGLEQTAVLSSDDLHVTVQAWPPSAGPCPLEDVPAGAAIDRRDDQGDPRVLVLHEGQAIEGIVCDVAHAARCTFDASTPAAGAQGLSICLSMQRAP